MRGERREKKENVGKKKEEEMIGREGRWKDT